MTSTAASRATGTPNADIRDRFREYFDQWAPDYATEAFSGPGLAWSSNRELEAMHTLGPLAGASVCDIGVGTGRIATWLASQGASVIGVDQADGMLRHPQTQAATVAVVKARVGDPLPFPDGQFDVVTCMRVVKYVEDLAGVMAELSRIVRPGGQVLVEISNRRSLARFGYNEPVHLSTLRELRDAGAGAGLHETSLGVGTHLPHPVFRWANTPRRLKLVINAERCSGTLVGAHGARSLVWIGRKPA